MDVQEVTTKVERIAALYSERFGVEYSGDWFLLKLQEELGEMTQAHLILTNRTRRKIASEQEGRDALGKEVADVFAYVLLFAKQMNIDVEEELAKKWYPYLENK